MSANGIDGPPKPRQAFRVGVVGHRLNRLPADGLGILQNTIHRILVEIAGAMRMSGQEFSDLYTEEAPILRAISPLAEGTDRIFADEALKLGYELCCPLPFYQEEFEKDFTGPESQEKDSLAHFRAILETAREGSGLTVFELDGERAHAPEAYGAAGHVVLNQSDLLIVVWDGQDARGAGGTVDTLDAALRAHVPVICIDAIDPHRYRLLRTHGDLATPDRLSQTLIPAERLPEVLTSIVHEELRLPFSELGAVPGSKTATGNSNWLSKMLAPFTWLDTGSDTVGVRNYFAEPMPNPNSGLFWKLFRSVFADKSLRLAKLSLEDFESQIRREWPVAADGGPRPSPVTDWINTRLRVAFGWADGLADHYANMHRSAFIRAYLLAACAVFAALVLVLFLPGNLGPSGEQWAEIILGGLELLVLYWVLLLQMKSRRQYHERWTDYRLLAELIRELRFMVPLGGATPPPRVPPYLQVYGDPAQTWMYWYNRALARQIGIPAARATPDYIRDCTGFLDRVVGDEESGQRGFHIRAEKRARNLDTRLRWVAGLLFKLTIVGVAARLVLAVLSREPAFLLAETGRVLLFFAGVLPAFGAALEGINNQGEFLRVAKRSAAMASAFRGFAIRIAALKKGAAPHLGDVASLSDTIAATMIAEVLDWRAVFIDRR